MVKAATRTAGGYFQDAGEFSSLEEALAGYLGVWCDPDLSEVVAVGSGTLMWLLTYQMVANVMCITVRLQTLLSLVRR
jgi:hypothetical protein